MIKSTMTATVTQEERLLLIDLQRLLHCMQHNESPPDQSWEALLLRAQLAQDLWQSVAQLESVRFNNQLHAQLAQQVDRACRRAHEIADLQRQDSPPDLVERIFFRSTTITPQLEDIEDEVDDEMSLEGDDDSEPEHADNNNNNDNNEEPEAKQSQSGTYKTASMSTEQLQKEQREQMEEAVAQMAAQMKAATQNIHSTIQQQTGHLGEMEDVVEQNVQDVTKVVQNVKDHNVKTWKSSIGTWTLLLTLVGVFAFCLMTIFTIPKRPGACLFFCQDPTNKLLKKHEQMARRRVEPDEYGILYEGSEEEQREKERLDKFMQGSRTADSIKNKQKPKTKVKDPLDWRHALSEEVGINAEDEADGMDPFAGRKAVDTDPFAGRKAVDTDPFAGRKAVDTDPFAGRKAVDSDPFAGRKVVDTDPFAGRKAVDTDPFAGRKVVDTDPFAGRKVVDTDSLAGRKDIDTDPLSERKMVDTDPFVGKKDIDTDPLSERKVVDTDSFAGRKDIDTAPLSERNPIKEAEIDPGNGRKKEDPTLESVDEETIKNRWDSPEGARVEDYQDYQGHGSEKLKSVLDSTDQEEDTPEPLKQKVEDVADSLLASLSEMAKKKKDCELDSYGICIERGGGSEANAHARGSASSASKKPRGDELPDRLDPPNIETPKAWAKDVFARSASAEQKFSPRDVRFAAGHGDHKLLITYLDAKPEYVDRTDKNGWTALHLAIRAGQTPSVQFLLKYKADVNVMTNDGRAPLAMALELLGKNHRISQMLRREGAKVAERDHDEL
jgi:ribosome recycling factor